MPQARRAPPLAQMLTAVDAVMQDDEVRVITDTVSTTSANVVGVNVEAEVYLYPDSSANVLEGIEAAIRAGCRERGRLGWDLTLSWLIKNIHVDGVQRVELISPTIIRSPTMAPPSALAP